MANSDLRISIEGATRNICLASLSKADDGSVYVSVRVGDKQRDMAGVRGSAGSARHDLDIQEQRISIHSTPSSDTINVLNFRNVLKDGQGKEPVRAFTGAIKAHRKFAFLLSRYGNYPANVKPKDKNIISLGKFDDARFLVHWSLFIGSTSLPWTASHKVINHHVFDFAGLRFCVLWSFMPLAAPCIGSTINVVYQQRDDARESPGVIELDDTECFLHHEELDRPHFDEAARSILNTMAFPDLYSQQVMTSCYSAYAMMRVGQTDTFEYLAFRALNPAPPLTAAVNVIIHGPTDP
jgi:hypothetical protein